MGFDASDHDHAQHPVTHMPRHSKDLLRSLVKRVQNLEQEIAERNEQKSEVYGEAKALGFDKKTLRKLVSRLRKPKEVIEEEDVLLDLYERAYNRDPLEE